MAGAMLNEVTPLPAAKLSSEALSLAMIAKYPESAGNGSTVSMHSVEGGTGTHFVELIQIVRTYPVISVSMVVSLETAVASSP